MTKEGSCCTSLPAPFVPFLGKHCIAEDWPQHINLHSALRKFGGPVEEKYFHQLWAGNKRHPRRPWRNDERFSVGLFGNDRQIVSEEPRDIEWKSERLRRRQNVLRIKLPYAGRCSCHVKPLRWFALSRGRIASNTTKCLAILHLLLKIATGKTGPKPAARLGCSPASCPALSELSRHLCRSCQRGRMSRSGVVP